MAAPPTSPLEAQAAPVVGGSRLSGAGIVACAGVAAILGLTVAGRADPASALIAGLAVAALGVGLAWQGRTRTDRQVGAADTSPHILGDLSAPPFEDALENLPDPMLIVTAEEPDDLAGKRLNFANSAARTLLRIPREGALLLAAIRRPEVLESVDESLFGGLSGEVSFETGGAQDRFWRVWTAPLPARGARRYCVIIMRDETDARRNERMRADFLANASHELRTPLASLSGFIETLRGHARDDEQARDKFLAIMGAQAERMARLVDDLLSLSRIELNEHIRPEGCCDLSLAVTDVVDAVALLAKAKSVTFEIEQPARGEALITGDRDQIVQVIQNLVDNAVKYSPVGGTVLIKVKPGLKLDAATAVDPASPRLSSPNGGRLSLLTPDRSEAVKYVAVKVVDGGPGLERQHLPRLAERFYRVEGQKSGERSGTGLGLAIVKHITNRHRGGLWVESAPDRGAAFTAYFPMVEKPAEPAGVGTTTPAQAALAEMGPAPVTKVS